MSGMSMDQLRDRIEQERSQLYLIVMQPTESYDVSSELGRDVLRRHLQWQFSMEDQGILLGAGPFNQLGQAQTQEQFRNQVASHSDMLNASGMYIIAAESAEAAEAIARTEPFEAMGWRTHRLVVWNLNEGLAWRTARQMMETLQQRAAH